MKIKAYTCGIDHGMFLTPEGMDVICPCGKPTETVMEKDCKLTDLSDQEATKTASDQYGVYALSRENLRRLENNFVYHAPKPGQSEKYLTLRNDLKQVSERIMRLTPPSREQACALTHLEEAMFWANAAIARNE